MLDTFKILCIRKFGSFALCDQSITENVFKFQWIQDSQVKIGDQDILVVREICLLGFIIDQILNLTKFASNLSTKIFILPNSNNLIEPIAKSKCVAKFELFNLNILFVNQSLEAWALAC
ncbi:hypothetical protein BpHYR1_052667 [Brachionus plicatilis]|uniref:Uncharacterized protein n=1 Tax=Brachionus plicatilis TaxID=10195 RepID=A0A3M7QEL1_BRAPC|nr:hypothetical protein BpHYR1_052667 [Brachionus plicatilis]